MNIPLKLSKNLSLRRDAADARVGVATRADNEPFDAGNAVGSADLWHISTVAADDCVTAVS